MKAIRVGMGSCEEVAVSAFLKLFGEVPDKSFKCISFEANMINRLFSLGVYVYARQRAAGGAYGEFLSRRKGLSRFPVNALQNGLLLNVSGMHFNGYHLKPENPPDAD